MIYSTGVYYLKQILIKPDAKGEDTIVMAKTKTEEYAEFP